jgi:Glutathione S-transferase, C-terminal domain
VTKKKKRFKSPELQTFCQGLGRHSKGDLQRMGIEDLTAVSTFLGSKTFMLGGDKPSDLDAVLVSVS